MARWYRSIDKALVNRLAVAIFLVTALSGCSSVYDIRTVVIDGKIAFIPTSTFFWNRPDCINGISVRAMELPQVTTRASEDIGIPEDSIVWERDFDNDTCENPFPVKYGSVLRGGPWPDMQDDDIEAQPLRVGVVYEVSTRSDGSATGYGKFRIGDNRKVENLPL